jgi:hypothetical protein
MNFPRRPTKTSLPLLAGHGRAAEIREGGRTILEYRF